MSLVSYGRYRGPSARPSIGAIDTIIYRGGFEIEVSVAFEYTPGDRDYDDCPAYDADITLTILSPPGLVLSDNERARLEEQVCEVVAL
jgi:hypothetical protein